MCLNLCLVPMGSRTLHPLVGTISSNRSEAKDITAGEVGAAPEGIIVGGDDAGRRLIGVGIALEVVNWGSAGIETENGIAGGAILDGATKSRA
jgi:hypothetical protein